MFGMDPVLGLALMIGMVAVVPTSDTFASVLMGIPGSSASQATVLDGFPMAKKGQAARALSAAFTSSLFGGLVGAAFLTMFIVIARPIVLSFGLPEMLMISILGLSMVAVLAGRVALKGLAAAGLGLLIGTIGEADAGGSLRMATYDIPYLTDGLKLVIVGLGIFAVPEIVSLLRQDRAISKEAKLGAGWGEGVRDWVANKWLSVRCSGGWDPAGCWPGWPFLWRCGKRRASGQRTVPLSTPTSAGLRVWSYSSASSSGQGRCSDAGSSPSLPDQAGSHPP